MTDNEIIKVLECSTKQGFCETCKYREKHITDENFYWCECGKTCVNGSAWESAILDLINRLQAENERLQKHNTEYARKHYQDGRADAIKEFAEKIYTEINEALAQNHKVKVERINKLIARGIKSNDEFCYEIDGKILALRGIGDFIQNLEKEMVGEE